MPLVQVRWHELLNLQMAYKIIFLGGRGSGGNLVSKWLSHSMGLNRGEWCHMTEMGLVTVIFCHQIFQMLRPWREVQVCLIFGNSLFEDLICHQSWGWVGAVPMGQKTGLTRHCLIFWVSPTSSIFWGILFPLYYWLAIFMPKPPVVTLKVNDL